MKNQTLKGQLKLIVNPDPPTPAVPPSSVELDESLAAADRLEAFLKADFCVPTLMKPLSDNQTTPLERVFLIRWTHELEELKAKWLGHVDGVRASVRGSATGEE